MTYKDIVFAWNAQHVNNGPLVGDGRMWDVITDRERIEFALSLAGEVEKQEPVAYLFRDMNSGGRNGCLKVCHITPCDGAFPVYTAPQPCPECEPVRLANVDCKLHFDQLLLDYESLREECEKLKADFARSEDAWQMLDNDRVQYLNDVGDVLGQNNTDESLLNAAKRVMATVEFQKKAVEAYFVRMARMEVAVERMRIAGGKDEFQKAFDDAKGLL